MSTLVQDFDYRPHAFTGYGGVPDNWSDSQSAWHIVKDPTIQKSVLLDDGEISALHVITRSSTESAGPTYAAGPGLNACFAFTMDKRIRDSTYFLFRFQQSTAIGYIASVNLTSGTCGFQRRNGGGFLSGGGQ